MSGSDPLLEQNRQSSTAPESGSGHQRAGQGNSSACPVPVQSSVYQMTTFGRRWQELQCVHFGPRFRLGQGGIFSELYQARAAWFRKRASAAHAAHAGLCIGSIGSIRKKLPTDAATHSGARRRLRLERHSRNPSTCYALNEKEPLQQSCGISFRECLAVGSGPYGHFEVVKSCPLDKAVAGLRCTCGQIL